MGQRVVLMSKMPHFEGRLWQAVYFNQWDDDDVLLLDRQLTISTKVSFSWSY